MKNTLNINATIYFDTDKTNVSEAVNEFWNYVSANIDTTMEIEVEDYDLRNSGTWEVIDK